MNMQDTMVSPPLLNAKKKKPVHERFGDAYVESKEAMSEIMQRKKHRQMLQLTAKEKQYAELKLTDDWAEVARSLYYAESDDVPS